MTATLRRRALGCRATVRRSLRLLIPAALALATPMVSFARVDLYVGFMDEEVNDVLAAVLRQHPNRRVIVVERTQTYREGSLFERPMSYYNTPFEVAATSASEARVSVPQTNLTPQEQLRLALSRRMYSPEVRSSLEAAMASGPDPKTRTRDGALNTDMTLVTFNPNASDTDPIVLVRSPEMGLQPSMVEPYLRPIVDSVSALPQAARRFGGVHASVFGTSGAVSAREGPGTVSSVSGSVFVGSEVVPGSTPRRYRGVVALASRGSDRPTYFYNAEFATRDEAEAAARREFTSRRGELRALSDGSVPAGTRLANAVEDAARFTDHTVSLTVSFFGGDDVKEAGRALGRGRTGQTVSLSNVNMEDYPIFRTLSGHVTSVDVARLNCDPHHISEEMVRDMSRWGRSARYSLGAYEDAILWGLSGSRVSEAPDSLNWSFFAHMSDATIRRYGYPLTMRGGRRFVLDPFLSEIASDFLNDAAAGRIFSSTVDGQIDYTRILSRHIVDRLSPAARTQLNFIMSRRSGEIQEIARDVLARIRNGEDPSHLRNRIRSLLEMSLSIDIPRNTALHSEVHEALLAMERAVPRGERARLAEAHAKRVFFENEGRIRVLSATNTAGGGAEASMEIWVRERKWAGNQARTLDHLLAEPIIHRVSTEAGAHSGSVFVDNHEILRQIAEEGGINGSNVDRALYKSTITPATQTLSADRVAAETRRLRQAGAMSRPEEVLRPALDVPRPITPDDPITQLARQLVNDLCH